MSQGQPPEFVKPFVSFDALNQIAKAAFSVLDVQGGDVSITPGGVRITIPDQEEVVLVRLVEDDGSGSGTGSGSGASTGPKPWGWVEVVPAPFGLFEDAPSARTGTSSTSPAYQAGNQSAKAGDIVRIYYALSFRWGSIWRREYRFWAGGGSGERRRIEIVTGVCLTSNQTGNDSGIRQKPDGSGSGV